MNIYPFLISFKSAYAYVSETTDVTRRMSVAELVLNKRLSRVAKLALCVPSDERSVYLKGLCAEVRLRKG